MDLSWFIWTTSICFYCQLDETVKISVSGWKWLLGVAGKVLRRRRRNNNHDKLYFELAQYLPWMIVYLFGIFAETLLEALLLLSCSCFWLLLLRDVLFSILIGLLRDIRSMRFVLRYDALFECQSGFHSESKRSFRYFLWNHKIFSKPIYRQVALNPFHCNFLLLYHRHQPLIGQRRDWHEQAINIP